MVIGMSLSAFTTLHVLISFAALLAGVIVTVKILQNSDIPLWTWSFLATSFLVSATGFMFPAQAVLPPHVVGGLSLLIFVATVPAYLAVKKSGRLRAVYVIGTLVLFYFNAFVTVVQAFLKVPALHELAPQGSEPPFAVAQAVLLVAFVYLGVRAMRAFRPTPTVVGAAG